MSKGRDVVHAPQSESVKPKIEKFLKTTGDCLSGKITPAEAFCRISNRPVEAVPESVKTPIISQTEIVTEQHQTNHEIEEIKQQLKTPIVNPEINKTTPSEGLFSGFKKNHEQNLKYYQSRVNTPSEKMNRAADILKLKIKGAKNAVEYYDAMKSRGIYRKEIIKNYNAIIEKESDIKIVINGIDRLASLGIDVATLNLTTLVNENNPPLLITFKDIIKIGSIDQKSFQDTYNQLDSCPFIKDTKDGGIFLGRYAADIQEKKTKTQNILSVFNTEISPESKNILNIIQETISSKNLRGYLDVQTDLLYNLNLKDVCKNKSFNQEKLEKFKAVQEKIVFVFQNLNRSDEISNVLINNIINNINENFDQNNLPTENFLKSYNLFSETITEDRYRMTIKNNQLHWNVIFASQDPDQIEFLVNIPQKVSETEPKKESEIYRNYYLSESGHNKKIEIPQTIFLSMSDKDQKYWQRLSATKNIDQRETYLNLGVCLSPIIVDKKQLFFLNNVSNISWYLNPDGTFKSDEFKSIYRGFLGYNIEVSTDIIEAIDCSDIHKDIWSKIISLPENNKKTDALYFLSKDWNYSPISFYVKYYKEFSPNELVNIPKELLDKFAPDEKEFWSNIMNFPKAEYQHYLLSSIQEKYTPVREDGLLTDLLYNLKPSLENIKSNYINLDGSIKSDFYVDFYSNNYDELIKLPEDFFKTLNENDKNLWQSVNSLTNLNEQLFLLKNKKKYDSFFINGAIQSSFYEQYYLNKHNSKILNISDEIINTFSDEKQQMWRRIINLEDSRTQSFLLRKYIIREDKTISIEDGYFDKNNLPTPKFYKEYFYSNIYAPNYREDILSDDGKYKEVILFFNIPENILNSTEFSSEKDFWQSLISLENINQQIFLFNKIYGDDYKRTELETQINQKEKYFNSDFSFKSDFFIDYIKENIFSQISISKNVINRLSPEDQKIWTAIVRLDNKSKQYFFIESFNVEKYIKESSITSEFYFDYYHRERNNERIIINEIDLQNFSEEDKDFWRSFEKINLSGLEYFLLSHKEEYKSLITTEYLPNVDFFKLALKEGVYPSNLTQFINSELINNCPQNEIPFWEKIIKYQPGLQSKILEKFYKNKEINENIIKEVENFGSIYNLISNSYSKEILKIKDQLISELIKTKNPIEIYEKISDIFIKNNLPTVGKIYKIFNLLYPSKNINQSFRHIKNLSPVLASINNHHRRDIIFRDLVDIHLKSGNRSLKNYLQFFASSNSVLDKSFKGIPITSKEERQLSYFFAKLETLYDNSIIGRREKQPKISKNEIRDKVNDLYQRYHVKEGQSISNRVAEIYLSSIGITNIDQALELIKNSQNNADKRNRNNYFSLNENRTISSDGVLLKGIESNILESILDGGSLAREYLGSNSGSDSTPFDTDTIKIDSVLTSQNFRETLSNSESFKYGPIALIVKNRGQFQDTSKVKSEAQYQADKLEIFYSGFASNQHYGVRTGFSSSEIDYIVIQNESLVNDDKLNDIYYQIAKHGVYIPVLNLDSQVIYTPELYDEYRKSFDGVAQFDGKEIKVSKVETDSRFYSQVQEIKKESIDKSNEVLEKDKQIREKVREILQELNITLKDEYDTSTIGASFQNIGSSGRNTNLPNDFDFDYTLILDGPNYSRASEVINLIVDKIKHSGTVPTDRSEQIRLSGVSNLGSELIDLDIGINTTADTLIFGSHQAIQEKLESIRNSSGEDAYNEVVANIVLTKKILKENHAYKKGNAQDGGIGGIGVENWILANGGSIENAFRSFWQTSHNENGELISLSKFQKKYPIRDAGENLRESKRSHDNFIYSLQEKGYFAMIQAIEKYIK